MFRPLRSFRIQAARFLSLAVICWSLTGCAAVVTSMAMLPVHIVSDAIARSTQVGIDIAAATAAATVRSSVESNE